MAALAGCAALAVCGKNGRCIANCDGFASAVVKDIIGIVDFLKGIAAFHHTSEFLCSCLC